MKSATKAALIIGILGNVLTFAVLGRIHGVGFIWWLFSLFLIETYEPNHELMERSN